MKAKNGHSMSSDAQHEAKALISPTPWDAAVFGFPTWEVGEYSESALALAASISGHHTIRVDPLADKRMLHDYGFYYCDTLIEPYCIESQLRRSVHPEATISLGIESEKALKICHGAFVHGRFHRDFNLANEAADVRYDRWLVQLLEKGQVYGLYWQDTLAGFMGYERNSLVLHAVASQFRGKGLAKYWWSEVCGRIFDSGHAEIISSISASNLAILKLYASLGFSFRGARDVYHRITP